MYENSENNFNNNIEQNDKVNMDQYSPSTSQHAWKPKDNKVEIEMELHSSHKIDTKGGSEDVKDELNNSQDLHD